MTAGATMEIDEARPRSIAFGATLRRTFVLVERDWPWILLLTLALGVALPVTYEWLPLSGYHRGSHDLPRFSIYAVKVLGYSLFAFFWPLTITAVCLRTSGSAPLTSVWRALRAVPGLLPVWLCSSLDTIYGLCSEWSDWPAAFRPRGNAEQSMQWMMSIIWIRLLADLLIYVAVTLSVSIAGAVAVAEQRAGKNLIVRTWRLLSGSRWKVLAVNLLIASVSFIPSLFAGFVEASLRRSGDRLGGEVLRWSLFSVDRIAMALWAIAAAAIFVELLRRRDGVVYGDITHVFA